MMFRLTAAALLALAAAAPASAQMVARAERGTVPVIAAGPQNFDAPVTVARGDVLWTETVRPQMAARLLGAVDRRPRPSTNGVPAGTLLFGVRLRSGWAYCPAIDYGAPVARVQCFRDFDDNGMFDGGYVSDQRGLKARIMTSYVHGLASVGRVPYESIDPGEALDSRVRVGFDGFNRAGEAQFRLWLDDERMIDRYECRPFEGAPEGACMLLGLVLRIERQGDRAAVTPLGSAANRTINFTIRDPLNL